MLLLKMPNTTSLARPLGSGSWAASWNVHFKHPGCKEPFNVLFTLRRHDGVRDAQQHQRGVHHDTARIACAILAGNAWDGHFTTDRGGVLKLSLGPDDTLLGDSYYFWPDTSRGTAGE